jgi:cysteine desulfurase/selenocysteine lyase
MVAIGHNVGAAHDSVDDPALLDLHARLTKGGVVHTVRKGLLRLSLHAYNDLSDVERVCSIAGAWAREQPARQKVSAKG